MRPAFIMVRIRALSRATIGKTMGRANMSFFMSASESVLAVWLSPTMTGVIAVSLCPVSKPMSSSPFLKC